MRFLLTTGFICFCLAIFSQNNFGNQVEAVLKDTVNGFQTFQGKFIENPKMGWPYHSSRSDIEGTDDNRVGLFGERSYYSARVINPNSNDSILTDELLYVWIEKLIDILGSNFIFKTTTHPPGFKAYYIKRYGSSQGHLSVFISHNRPDPADRTYSEVRINFEYTLND